MVEKKRGLFGRLWDRGEDTARSTKRDVVEGLTFLPRAMYEGLQEGLAATREAGEHERTVMNWELLVLGAMIIGILFVWWLLHLAKIGGVGMILAALAAVVYFNKIAREKLRAAISRWLRSKGGSRASATPNMSPTLLREMAMVRLARVKHRLAIWDDTDKDEKRELCLGVLAAILDDITFDGQVVVPSPLVGEGEGAPVAADPPPPMPDAPAPPTDPA